MTNSRCAGFSSLETPVHFEVAVLDLDGAARHFHRRAFVLGLQQGELAFRDQFIPLLPFRRHSSQHPQTWFGTPAPLNIFGDCPTVRNVGRFTPIYVALIDPLRKLIVYTFLPRSVRASWNQTFGAG